MPCQENLSRRALWAGNDRLISRLMAKALEYPNLVSLAAGFTDQQTLPAGPTQKALEKIWSNPERTLAALQYGTTIGYGPLRELLLQRMLDADGRTAAEMNLSADQIVVTPGSNVMLFLVADTLFDPGDVVLCSAPSYFVYLGLLANLGVQAVGIEADAEGLVPETLEEELSRRAECGELDRVKAIYAVSYYDNPMSMTMPAARREAVVELAKRYSKDHPIRIIEDTAYRELRYWGEDIPSMRSFDPEGDTVIVAGSFSKSFSPGIRVGWGVLPPDLVGPVLSQKGNIDFGSPNFNQYLMHTVLAESLFDDHVEWIRASYRKKIDAMLDAANEFLAPIDGTSWIRPNGGLYMWLQVPESIDTGLDGPLFDRAVDEGMLYVPGIYCYPSQSRHLPRNMIRLSFGVPSCEEIRRGVEALGRAIRHVVD